MIPPFIEKLETSLSQELPGTDIQWEMASSDRRIEAFPRKAQADTRQGAVMILLYPRLSRLCTLFMQRPVYKGVHSGQISFPGGKKEMGDNNLIETALRETEEEAGVDRDQIRVIGTLTPLYIPVSNIEVTPIVGYISYRPHFTPQKSEVAALFDAELDFFKGTHGIKEKEMEVRGTPLTVRYYDYKGQVIWGATAMMIYELMIIIERDGVTWQE